MSACAWEALWDDHAEWSQETFGPDRKRGPLGPIKHLQREVEELLAAPDDREEYADCLLLIFDAARRAGMASGDLVIEAHAKLAKNRTRKWNPNPDPDGFTEHERE